MERLITWLQHRPLANWLIIIAYFLLVVLPHEVVGAFIHELLFKGSVPGYNLSFMLIVAGVCLILLLPFVRCLVRRPPSVKQMTGLVLIMGLMVAAYLVIMVLATETIHFAQYAVLAILLFPRLRNMSETAIAATGLGAVDEAYQFIWLIPADPGYYDFNDVILNCLGVGLGLLLLRMCDRHDRNEHHRPVWRSPVWIAVVGTVLALTILHLAGTWSVFPGGDRGLVLMPQYPKTFWSAFYEKSFHIVHPLEAIIAVAILLGFFHWLLHRGRETA